MTALMGMKEIQMTSNGTTTKEANAMLIQTAVPATYPRGILRRRGAPRARALAFWSFVFSLILMIPNSVNAQVDTGAIQGTLTDNSGGRVPGATVVLQNEGTAFALTATTGQDGAYVFNPIHIGTYSVTVTAPGFQKESLAHLEVAVQQHRVADFALQPGAVTTTITVTSAAAALQTQDASLGQVVEAHEIHALPLYGRNYLLLAQLSAGTTSIQQDSRGLALSGSFISNGVPALYNDYLLDGIDNNSSQKDFINGAAYVIRPPVDAIDEFKVETANFSAEFGRSAGAVINAVTKSGKNRLYGNAWEFVRNQDMDAADYFVNAAGRKKGQYQRNQFGFTVGGPVYIPHVYNGVNKTFFFSDYEGSHIIQAVPFTSTVPTTTERFSGYTNYQDLITYQSGTQKDLLGRTTPLGTVFDPATTRAVTTGMTDTSTGLPATGTGYVRDPFPSNIVPANRIDPIAVGLLNLFPSATKSGIVNNYVSGPVARYEYGQYDERVDQYFSSRDQAFARVSFNSEPVFNPTPCPGLSECIQHFTAGDQQTNAVNVALSETHTFSPTTLNEFRLGYHRLHTTRTQPFYNIGTNVSARYGIPGVPYLPPAGGGLPSIGIGGLSQIGGSGSLPSNELGAESQIMDNISKQRGSHSLRFGFEYDRLKLVFLQPPIAQGAFVYSGQFTDVPNGNTASTGIAQLAILPGPSTVGGVVNLGGANQVRNSNVHQIDFRSPSYQAYIQDNWRVTRKLTLNLGVRWEDFPMPADDFGANANFVPGVPGSTAQYLIDDRSKNIALSPSFLSNLSKDGIGLNYSGNHALATVTPYNFAPRVGLAFQARQNLVVRAAYGMFYDSLFNTGGTSTGLTYPFASNLSYTNSNSSLPITPDNSIGLTSNGLLNTQTNPVFVNASGLSLFGQQYNWQTPYVQSANVSVQYLPSKNQSLTVSFVSTGGRHISTFANANLSPELLPPSASVKNYVPFPDFAIGSQYQASEGSTNYHGAQATYERRFSSGFSLLANYTWAKARTDATENLSGGSGNVGYRAPGVAGWGIGHDMDLAGFDARNTIHISGTYQLPFGKGKPFLSHGHLANAVVGGWALSGLMTYQSGNPINVGCTITTGAGTGCDALMVPGVGLYAGAHTVQHWANAAAFANPGVVTAVGQSSFAPLGGSPSQLRMPRFHRGDMSLQKRWQTSEHTALEFRGEFFNLTNTPNFANPASLNFGSAASFAPITATRDSPNDPRSIQLGLNLYF